MMKELVFKSILSVTMIIAFIYSALWQIDTASKNRTISDANYLRKLGFEVVTEENKCHAKIKDGSWRTCQRVLLVMGG